MNTKFQSLDEKAKEKLINRIRQMVGMSQVDNENEAALFAEKAQALLAEYNLSMSDIEQKSTGPQFIIDGELQTESLPWRRSLASAVAEMYFCSYFYTFVKKWTPTRKCGYIRYDKHSFVGEQHNVIIATEIFNYLDGTVDRLAKQGSMKYPVRERTPYITTFRHAAATRLYWRIKDAIAQAKRGGMKSADTGKALVVANLYDQTNQLLKAFLEQEFGKMKTSKVKHTVSHAGGLRDGREAGDSISLNKQVGGSNSTHLIGKK